MKINLTSYITLTVRTDYSNKLKRKGFVYISPDRGDRAFRGINVLENAWTNNDTDSKRLSKVLIHEIGHILGLQHNNTPDSIMHSQFPEQVVTEYSALYKGWGFSMFFPKLKNFNIEVCNFVGKKELKKFVEFFEISSD